MQIPVKTLFGRQPSLLRVGRGSDQSQSCCLASFVSGPATCAVAGPRDRPMLPSSVALALALPRGREKIPERPGGR